MNRKIKKSLKNNPIIVLAAIIAIVSFISMLIVQKKNSESLEVYNTPDHVENVEDDNSIDFESEIFVDNENRFSISIPKDWKKVTKDGYPTFIHQASGSSIQIQTAEYSPELNVMNAEFLSTQLADDGYTFTAFTRVNASQYELLYQDKKDSIYDYIEEVYWDREKAVKLLCIVNDENYAKLSMYYKEIIDSFVWDKADPIPEGYHLEYAPDAGFEVGIPDTWVSGVTDTSFYAMDDQSGATITITPIELNTYLDDFTSMNMSSLVQNGKNSFILEDFKTSHTTAESTSIYVSNNVQYNNRALLYSTGKIGFLLEFSYENGTIDSTVADTCLGLFRVFIEPTDIESSDGSGGLLDGYEQGVSNMRGEDTHTEGTEENGSIVDGTAITGE